MVRAAFAQRRKTLANNLAARGVDRTHVTAALAAMDLPPTARPEHLSADHYRRLAEAIPWPIAS